MGLALRIDDIWPDPPKIEPQPSLVRGGSVEAQTRNLVATLSRHVKVFEDYVDATMVSRQRLVESAEQLVASSAGSSPQGVSEDLEKAIRDLRQREEMLSSAWLPDIRSMERDRTRALRSRHPLQRGAYADLLRRRAQAMTSALEALRDVRLELAAISTSLDTEPASPAFDDPKALASYLDQL